MKKLLKTNTFENTVIVALSIILSITFLIPERSVDKQVEEYYNTYVQQLNTICPGKFKEPHQLIVGFKKLPDTTIGVCFRLLTKRYMYIDSDYWTYSYDYKRKQVLYHELSHCFLHKEHVDIPNNYMYYQDSEIMPHVFESQVIADMRTWCAE